MPTNVITQVDPLDLQGNIAIGISLPFNGPAGPFNLTYSTQDQIKSNLINLLLTSKGERMFNPEFGTDLKRFIYESISQESISSLKENIKNSIIRFLPEINATKIDIVPHEDNNTIYLTVNYNLKLSGTSDQVTVEFT